MHLFFDTETTGLPRNWKAPVQHVENWPRAVQLAWLVFDNQGMQRSARSYVIKPNGFTIPIEASRIHRITHEHASMYGVPLRPVLEEFGALVKAADLVVAHNISFDEKIIGAEFLRHGLENPIEAAKRVCTMERSTAFCKLPGPYGFKWPKLSELHQTLFGEPLVDAHDASVDIKATAKCFWEMRRRGIIQ